MIHNSLFVRISGGGGGGGGTNKWSQLRNSSGHKKQLNIKVSCIKQKGEGEIFVHQLFYIPTQKHNW